MNKIAKIKSTHPIAKADFIVYAIVVVLIFALYFALFNKKGEYVLITSPTGSNTYALDTNQTINIDNHITVIISNGYVYVSDADCPDKVCIKEGKKNRINQTIFCLPNSITITIISNSNKVTSG